jgi:hypothetical protein
VRAGARKVAIQPDLMEHIKEPDGEGYFFINGFLPTVCLTLNVLRRWLPHYAQTVPYSVSEVLTDLMNFAARTIVRGGFLVYWLPTTNTYKDSDLPRTPPQYEVFVGFSLTDV